MTPEKIQSMDSLAVIRTMQNAEFSGDVQLMAVA
jgi:hypothetical protein